MEYLPQERIAKLEAQVEGIKEDVAAVKQDIKELHSRITTGNREITDHIDRKIDDLGFLGQVRTDGSQKTTGLLNYTGFTSGAAAGTAQALTGAELYDEIATLITEQWAGVLNVDT